MTARDPWQESAACAGQSAEVFIPNHASQAAEARARAFCNGDDTRLPCPVKAQCLAEAMRVETGSIYHRWGIWGGLNPQERADLARARRFA